MLQVAIAGIHGRMGQSLLSVVANDPQVEVSFGTQPADEAKKSDWVTKTVEDITVQDPFDVLIDFTTPESSMLHVAKCCELSRPVLIGTTGLTSQQLAHIKQAANHIAVLQAANTSLGVNLCYEILPLLAQALPKDASVAIQEFHHQQKKDAPSGTALQFGQLIEENCSISVQYQSGRLANLPGQHTITLAWEDEIIEIKHTAMSRKIFALGALRAAAWLTQQPAGLYSIADSIQNK